ADPETPASALTVSASVASYSGGILESVTLEADSGGTNRAAIVKPVADATGVGVVILSVTDATGQTTTASFAVMVRPSAGVVLIDHFDYPFNTSILNSSPGFWVRRNSSAQGINFRTASSDAQAWIRPKSGADDASVPLSGGPYVPGSGTVLFTMFKAQWIDVGDVRWSGIPAEHSFSLHRAAAPARTSSCRSPPGLPGRRKGPFGFTSRTAKAFIRNTR
ncbi:MAG TPA: hypothetical protein P5022_18115, partial [Candidatus Paceibacterota bacterium]|nr:hypothetical protein [Candidatus Paceibacterota bacterium]